MDLFVDGNRKEKLTEQEQALIDRAKVALKNLNFSIPTTIGHTTYTHIVAAIAWARDDEVGIDFKAYVPGLVGQAFLGPEAPLTEALFAGDQFTEEFLKKIHESVDHYIAHLNECRKEEEAKTKPRRR